MRSPFVSVHRLPSIFASLVALGLVAGSTACSILSSDEDTDTAANSPDGGSRSDDSSDIDPEDPVNQPPHAQGTITLGETHATDSSTAYPYVSAYFVPDATAAKSCKKKLEGGCEILQIAKCGTEEDGNACDAGEACVFDDTCKPKCKKVAVCSKDCDDDEACTLDKSGKAVCAKIETFDAGPLAFSGTTTAITLFPPYAFKADGNGAPFVPGAEIKVHAQGATDAGFEAFDQTFTATTFMQSKPKLSKISRDEAFGADALPISWVPGKDSIVITISGAGGSVTCKASDSDGKFAVPRSAVDAALGDDESPYGTPSLAISVARQRKETKKGLKTTGELANATVQAEGWLDLVTSSAESATIVGCPSGETSCGDECVDVKSDTANCGACGKACSDSLTCSAGKCVAEGDACQACGAAAETGTCKTQWNACQADPSCGAFFDCATSCGSTDGACINSCYTSNGSPKAALNFLNCQSTACSTQCQ